MLFLTRRIMLGAALVAVAGLAGPASAQTKLKWAHVSRSTRPSVPGRLGRRGDQEAHRRQYAVGVFPASRLGNENPITEALGLATVDMIYTGVLSAG